MLKAFESMGEAAMLREQANAQIATSLATTVDAWIGKLRGWLGSMPATMPPTEWQPRR